MAITNILNSSFSFYVYLPCLLRIGSENAVEARFYEICVNLPISRSMSKVALDFTQLTFQ